MTDSLTQSERTALLVLGMHRSGTSLLSGLIASAGVNLGKTLMAPASDNPKGFWENQTIVDFNETLLNHFGQTWASWQALPTDWLGDEHLVASEHTLNAILDAEFGDADTICIKDPRMCRLLPFWHKALSAKGFRVLVLLISRPAAEVAASLEARDSIGPRQGRALWLRYSLDAADASRELTRFSTSYAALLEKPAEFISTVQREASVSLVAKDMQLADGSLRHHYLEGDSADAWATPLHDYLRGTLDALSVDYQTMIVPLVMAGADLELALAQARANSSETEPLATASDREQVLFAQMQEAKQYAGSMADELSRGREYIINMEAEVARQREAVVDKDQQIAELSKTIETKNQDLSTQRLSFEEDIARREEYTASLLSHIEAKEAELAAAREELARLKHRFRHLIRAAQLLGNRESGS
ncbi:MAG: hypothetical protein AAGI24_02105 [Pseudomonadota bacterium]